MAPNVVVRSVGRRASTRRARFGRALFVLLVGLSLPYEASAADSRQFFRDAKSAYDAAEFDAALEFFRKAVGPGTTLDYPEQAVSHMYTACIHFTRKDQEAARKSLESAVAADPDYSPNPNIFQPEYRDAYLRVRDSRTGKVKIDTVPPGARIEIAGHPFGVTPFEGRIWSGDQQIKLMLESYRDILISQVIAEGDQVTQISNRTFERRSGTLKVVVTPADGQIYLNNDAPVTGSFAREVPEGLYDIEGRLDGYISDRDSVRIADQDVKEVTLLLMETPEHATARQERALRAEADEIHDSKASSKKRRTILGMVGTSGCVAAGVVFYSQAQSSLDQYNAAVDPGEIDQYYSDYESMMNLSTVAFAAGGVVFGLTVLNMIKGVPSSDDILHGLMKDKGLSGHLELGTGGSARVKLTLQLSHSDASRGSTGR